MSPCTRRQANTRVVRISHYCHLTHPRLVSHANTRVVHLSHYCHSRLVSLPPLQAREAVRGGASLAAFASSLFHRHAPQLVKAIEANARDPQDLVTKMFLANSWMDYPDEDEGEEERADADSQVRVNGGGGGGGVVRENGGGGGVGDVVRENGGGDVVRVNGGGDVVRVNVGGGGSGGGGGGVDVMRENGGGDVMRVNGGSGG